MKCLLTIIMFVGFYLLGMCQDKINNYNLRPDKTISLGVFGEGLVSLNYEYLKILNKYTFFAVKFGVGYTEDIFVFGNSMKDNSLFNSHQILVGIGEKEIYIDFGLGGAVYLEPSDTFYYIFPVFGLRYLPLRRKEVSCRIFVHKPIPIGASSNVFILPFGVSVGWSF